MKRITLCILQDPVQRFGGHRLRLVQILSLFQVFARNQINMSYSFPLTKRFPGVGTQYTRKDSGGIHDDGKDSGRSKALFQLREVSRR